MGSYYLAKIYVAMENYDEAEMWLQKTRDIKPTFRPASIDLGMLYRSQNKNDKAMEVYRDFLRADPYSTAIRFELGNILLKLKKYNAAAEEFKKILRLDDSLADVHFSLGLSYFSVVKNTISPSGNFLRRLNRVPIIIEPSIFSLVHTKRRGSTQMQ